jgi:hypothetical protein
VTDPCAHGSGPVDGRFQSGSMRRHLDWYMGTNVLDGLAVFMFREVHEE